MVFKNICYFILWLNCSAYGIRWLALSKSTFVWNETSSCSRPRDEFGLVRRQRKLCERHLEFMPAVVAASVQTQLTCRRTFADRRWNCSSLALAPRYLPDINNETREQAFVYALSTAALVSAIAKTCSSGHVFGCTCGQLPRATPSGDFKWGGCADNLKFSLQLSKRFTEQAEPTSARAGRALSVAISRHNNVAGRKAVHQHLQLQCKCHGVSGACSVRTCWRAVAPLDSVGRGLRRRYLLAAEVALRRVGQAEKLLPVNAHLGMFATDDLVYATKSPDYCARDVRVGSYGTTGRYCNASSEGNIGCGSMCCGRGHVTFIVEKVERCHCKYYWCCYVKCKTCSSWVEMNECK